MDVAAGVIDARCVCGARLDDGHHRVTASDRAYHFDDRTRRVSGVTSGAEPMTATSGVRDHDDREGMPDGSEREAGPGIAHPDRPIRNPSTTEG
jgi:hypothetical protein